MESKDVIRALLWAAVVFFGWQIIAVQIWPPPPAQDAPAPLADGTDADGSTEDAGGSTENGGGGVVTRTPDSAPGRANSSGDILVSSGAIETVTLGNVADADESLYRMDMVLSTVGASVVNARLSDFTDSVGDDAPRYPVLTEMTSPGGSPLHSFATERIYLRNWEMTVDLRNVAWDLESSGAGSAVFSLTVNHVDTPVLKVLKTFHLPEQPSGSMRHDLTITYALENLTDERQLVTVTHSGPVGLPQEDLRFNDRTIFVGAADAETTSVEQYPMRKASEQQIYLRNAEYPLSWTATANKYFVVFESPRAVDGQTTAGWVKEVKSVPVGIDAAGTEITATRTATDLLVVEPHETTRRVLDAYIGPKSRKAFQTVGDYQQRGYDEQVVASYSMGACAFMTPKALTRFMIWMLNFLKSVVHNYGIAIIILVLIVRTILHPVTKKGQVNMMRMQQQMGKLNPKMAELKKKYGNDKQKMNTETMKLYQEEGINPATGMLSSCVPMFLQMPIWIALFTSLNFNIDMRHQPFFLWITDLTAPDALIPFSQPHSIPLLSLMTGPITSFNLLPILVSVAMFAQQKLMPKPQVAPTGDKADQSAQMQKMMPFMTLFFGLFFYNMPSGLNLYIGASSFFGMLEQKRIRAHIEKLKNAPETVKSDEPKQEKKPGLFGKLRKAAEDAERLQTTRSKKKAK